MPGSVPAPTATTPTGENVVDERAQLLQRLHEYILRTSPGNRLIPVKGKKTLGYWRGDCWTEESWQAHLDKKGGYAGVLRRSDVAVSNRDWVVLDVDGDTPEHGIALCAYFEKRWPAMRGAPMERTKKGAHYFFRRTELCNELGLTGSARPFKEPDNPLCPTEGKQRGKLPIDMLTVARSRSGPIVVLTPSANKSWVPGRALWEVEMPALPDTMAYEFQQLKGGQAVPIKQLDDMTAEERAALETDRRDERDCAIREAFGEVDTDLVALVQLLNPSRACNYSEWIIVGLRLKNAGSQYFAVWEEFSALAPDGDRPDVLKKKWQGLPTNQASYSVETSMRALRGMAKQDNPDGYQAWKRSSIRGSVEAAVFQNSSLAAARAFATIMNGRVVTTDEGLTFAFEGHRWVKFAGDHAIGERVVDMLLPRVEELKHSLPDPGAEPDKPDKKATKEQKKEFKEAKQLRELRIQAIKNVDKLIFRLSNAGPRAEIIKDIRLRCRDSNRDFHTRLDTDPDLLGFENGVMDLRTKEFRAGRPEDMISLSALKGQGYQAMQPQETGILTYLKRIYPDPEVRDYIIKHWAYCLSGHRNAQLFHIHTGSGANGKSGIQSVCKKAFGEYCYTGDVSLLTQARPSSSSAQPDIIAFRGRRLVQFQEPENGGFNMPKVKNMTGNDEITARDLYEAPQTFKIIGCFHLACNTLPALPKNEDAVLNRLRVVDYPSKFKLGVQADEVLNIYPIDTTLDSRIPDLAQELITLLVRAYETGMAPVAPKSVTVASQEYFSSNSPLLGFKQGFLQQQAGAWIRYADMRPVIEEWLEAMEKGDPDTELVIPKGKELLEALSSLLGVKCKRDMMVDKRRYTNVFLGWTLVDGATRSERLKTLAGEPNE